MQDIHELLGVTGRVHSVETFGTVDGPGTRLVVFTQGCPLRCQYCHNPDSWEFGAGDKRSVGELLYLYERNEPFYRGGGITVSGGEPLLQPGFVAALFSAAHAHPGGRIHTALDTSGITFSERSREAIGEVLDETDLVLLDVKHPDLAEHEALTGKPGDRPRAFADELARRKVPTVVRHVVVPGVTDDTASMQRLGTLIAQWSNVVGLDLLPYHTMGVRKYRELGIEYPLAGVEPMDKARIPKLRSAALGAFVSARHCCPLMPNAQRRPARPSQAGSPTRTRS